MNHKDDPTQGPQKRKKLITWKFRQKLLGKLPNRRVNKTVCFRKLCVKACLHERTFSERSPIKDKANALINHEIIFCHIIDIDVKAPHLTKVILNKHHSISHVFFNSNLESYNITIVI